MDAPGRFLAVASALAAGLFAAGCQPGLDGAATPAPPAPTTIPSGEGLITGGIDACFGVPPKQSPGFVAGTVIVFGGSVTQVPWAGGSRDVLPTDMVAKKTVAAHQRYRIVLPPGKYVLVGRYAGATSDQVGPWVATTLSVGEDVVRDIPNECK
ncbi:MAG: hypothetical protein ACYDHB_05845 [Candidatus Dormibacteria bacterium]